MYDNNLDAEASHLRDTFFNAEREYVLHLLKNPTIREMIIDLNVNFNGNSKPLFEEAQKLIDDVDYGKIADEDMEKVEQKLTVLLAAIQDKTLRKELILLPDYNEESELSHGRSR